MQDRTMYGQCKQDVPALIQRGQADLLVLAASDLLQESGGVLVARQAEALAAEERHGVLSGSMEDDVACMHHDQAVGMRIWR